MARESDYIFTRYRPRHRFRNAMLGLLGGFVLILLCVWFANFVYVHQVKLERKTVTVTNLPGDLENWTILHLSDLHGEELGNHQAALKNVIGGINVSSIVMSGDMVGKDGDVTPLLEVIRMLPADKPKLFLPGDEDPEYLDPKAHASLSPLSDWAEKLVNAGVTILDEPLLFTRGKNDRARIWFVPEYLYSLNIDSVLKQYQNQLSALNTKGSLSADESAQKRVAQYQLDRLMRCKEAVASMQKTDIQIVVSHSPLDETYIMGLRAGTSKTDVFSLRQASLVLSGHTCGGMWRLPGGKAIYSPEYGTFPKDSLMQGFAYVGGIPQYISAGLGARTDYPLPIGRWFSQPTATIISLSAYVK